MIGLPIVRRAAMRGDEVAVVARETSDLTVLDGLDVRVIHADLTTPDPKVAEAVANSDMVVHTAAQVGDWGPQSDYRRINYDAVEHLLTAAARGQHLQRFVHLSALGVYQATHHYGTDETTSPDMVGFDGYTNTKAQAEELVNTFHQRDGVPTVIVRPGFTYGAGDRRILPRLIQRFRNGSVRMIGRGDRFLNNTYIDNVVDGLFLAMENEAAIGETFNMRDNRLVTRQEFLYAIADYLDTPRPGHVPEWLARSLRPLIEGYARWRGATEPPLLTGAAMKFMTLNLDFSIDKAKQLLGYQPRVDFREGIVRALDWAIENETRSTSG